MRRYLIIANQTLMSAQLRDTLIARNDTDDCEFHIVVPATRSRGSAIWTEGRAIAHARHALDDGIRYFDHLGTAATGEVGDENPILAVSDVLQRTRFDAIIISTLPPGISRWLKRDLPHRLARRFGLPVTHVSASRLTPVS